MAYTFYSNVFVDKFLGNFRATFIFYELKEGFKAKGWTHVASGDGRTAYSTTFGNGNDVMTSSAYGVSNGVSEGAYIILRQPTGGTSPYSGTREILIQLSNSSVFSIRFGYSLTGGFAGGSPDGDIPPNFPADIQFTAGTGPENPASATFQGWFGTFADFYFNFCFGGADENFGWYMFSYYTGSITADIFWCMDPMQPGTFRGTELDPYIMSTKSNELTNIHNLNLGIGWLGKGGVVTPQWGSWRGEAIPAIGKMPNNAQSGDIESMYILWHRQSSDGGTTAASVKGVSSLFIRSSEVVPYRQICYGLGFQTDYHICVYGPALNALGSILIPWRDAITTPA